MSEHPWKVYLEIYTLHFSIKEVIIKILYTSLLFGFSTCICTVILLDCLMATERFWAVKPGACFLICYLLYNLYS